MMTVTTLNQAKQFILQLTPRELSILISSLDYTLAGIDETRMIPESMVPQSARNASDPVESDYAAAVQEATKIKAHLVTHLPNWREL